VKREGEGCMDDFVGVEWDRGSCGEEEEEDEEGVGNSNYR